MEMTPLSAAHRASILRWGAALFLTGLVVGLLFTFEAIGRIEAWPLLPAIQLDIPGEEAAWRRAHLGAIINSMAMLAFAAVGSAIRLGDKGQRWYARCVIVTGWGNSVAFTIGALFGVRGLAFGGVAANSVVYFLFLIAAVTAIVQAVLLWRGAGAARG